MRVVIVATALLALAGCNDTNLENAGARIGAQADNAVDDVTGAADEFGNRIDNVANNADTAIEGAANAVDRQVDKVENAADAAARELER